MRWRLEFYNERRGILARYAVEAPLPAAAVLLGRNAVLAEHPPAPARGRLSLFARAERIGGQDASGWVLYRIVKDIVALVLILLLSLAITRSVDGEVPTAADFAACNEQAPEAIKTGSASPTMRDHARAESVRGGARTASSTDFTGNVIESADPQIHGMEGEGAKNATYQAAYRSCMRRKGF
jgi:hypothetical protein